MGQPGCPIALRHGGVGPFPDPSPLGAGTRRLPPLGGGWEGGGTLRAMVTSAVRAIRAQRPMNIAWERGRPARVTSPQAR